MTTRPARKPVPVTPDLRAHAARVHAEAVVVDGMCTDHIEDPQSKLAWNEPYLERLFTGGPTALNRGGAHFRHFADGVKEVRRLRLRCEHRPDRTLFVRTADDIRRAKREGKVGIIAGFQTSIVIEDDADYVGARAMQITYNERCYVGDGCQKLRPAGLSHFGVDVVKEMNRVGLVVDLAHVSDPASPPGSGSARASCRPPSTPRWSRPGRRPTTRPG